MSTPALFAAGRSRSPRAVLFLRVAFGAMLSLGLPAARAQTAPASQPASTEVVELSPLTVNAEKDTGFVATSALAGGRLATDLKDTPVAYSVLTREFLEAFNVTDLMQAMEWAPNTTTNPGNNTDQGFAFSPAINITMRGAAPSEANYPMRNFFPYNSVSDSYALDRFDFARGPNSILFGAAQFGGTPSSTTKQARTDRKIREVQVQYGSWSHLRATLDVNEPLNDKMAVRVAAMWDNSDTWRNEEWRRKKGVFATTTFKPSKSTNIRLEGEYANADAKVFPTSLLDQVSAWDGKTTFAGTVLPSAAPNAATLAAAGVSFGTNNANPQLSPLWVYDPSAFGTTNVLNFANTFRTKGAAGNSTAANANFIGGQRIASSSVSYAGAPMLYGYDVPAGRYDTDLAGSSSFHVPAPSTTNLWSNGKPTQSQISRDASFTFNQRVGTSLFFEIAGDINQVDVNGNNAVNRGLNTEYIDITQTLPNGATNPNYLHPYTEYWTYLNQRSYQMRSGRASAAYVKDFAIGRMQVGAMVGGSHQVQQKRSYLYLLPLTAFGPDARYWDGAQASTALWNRLYLDQAGRDFYKTDGASVTLLNQDGTSASMSPRFVLDASRKDNSADNITNYKFVQAAANFNLFNNRLVLIGAARRDITHLGTRNTLLPGDYPADWDGSTILFKPNAPSDWATLMFTPKDASGNPTGSAQPADTRPRLSVPATSTTAANSIQRQPQYAGDRFRDDYNPPDLNVGVNTFSLGGTYNVKPWLGVFANVATNFNPNLLVQRLDGSLLAPTAAHGDDAGIRFNTTDRRLSASLGVFDSYQTNSPVNPPSNFVGNYNSIYAAPVVGDLSPTGRNQRNVAALPAAIRDTQTQKSRGVELELTANLTHDWSVLFNASYTQGWQTDTYPDSVAYIAAQDQVVRQILGDAGVLISPTNVASINPALNDPTKINVGAVTSAVNAWNSLQTSVIPNMVTGRQKLIGSTNVVANLGTNYTFHEGRLRGFSAGFGLHYRGRTVVGFRGSDTIVNSANPATAIDDPSVDAYTPVYSKPYHTAEARLGYLWKRADHHDIQFNLNVANLFNERAPVYFIDIPGAQTSNTTLRPRGGDVTSPAVETVPAGYALLNPLSFTLTASMKF